MKYILYLCWPFSALVTFNRCRPKTFAILWLIRFVMLIPILGELFPKLVLWDLIVGPTLFYMGYVVTFKFNDNPKINLIDKRL